MGNTCLPNLWQILFKMSSAPLLAQYLLTPCSRVLLEKLSGSQLIKKSPVLYGTQMFITAFTSARHLSLSWAILIQSTPPHPTSWRSILILSSHLRLGLQSGLFPSGFPTKTLYTSLLSPKRATCPAHLILLDFITRKILGAEYGSISYPLCSFLHSLVTSSLLSPNILLNTHSHSKPVNHRHPILNVIYEFHNPLSTNHAMTSLCIPSFQSTLCVSRKCHFTRWRITLT